MPQLPNVILITTDQHRADAMRCDGNPYIDTPHLDELADSGIRFENAFSECPCCVPARRCLMNGKSAYTNHQFNNHPQTPFDERPWLAEVFRNNGYQTYAVGKMHLSPLRSRIGFDDVILNEEGRRQDSCRMDDYERYLMEEGLLERAWGHGMPANAYHARPHVLPEEHMMDAWTVREAAKFIERRDPTRPFFLYVSFRNPHPALVPPQYYWDLYRDRQVQMPVKGEWVGNDEPMRNTRQQLNVRTASYSEDDRIRAIRAYYGLVTSIDHNIGVLMGQLNEHWLLGSTHILFTADHGEMLFDHESHAKGTFFRGSARIPMIVAPAPEFNPGIPIAEVRNHPMMLQDVMPTLLELSGIDVPVSIEGKSVVSVMKDKSTPLRDYAFGEFGDTEGSGRVGDKTYGLMDSQWKYIYFVEEGKEYLFDIVNDPNELKNYARDPNHKETLKLWRNRLINKLGERNDPDIDGGNLRVADPKPAKRKPHPIGGLHGIHWPSIPYYDFAPESLVTKFDNHREVWREEIRQMEKRKRKGKMES